MNRVERVFIWVGVSGRMIDNIGSRGWRGLVMEIRGIDAFRGIKLTGTFGHAKTMSDNGTVSTTIFSNAAIIKSFRRIGRKIMMPNKIFMA